MLLKLQTYDITMQFTPGKDVPVADLLSRKNSTKLDRCNQKFPEEIEYHVHAMYSHVPVADVRLQGDISLSLLEYWNTPICGSSSPAELLMGRSWRSILPVTTKHLTQKAPNNQEIRNKILNNQTNRATFYNRQAKALPPLTTGDHVHVQKEGKWDPAINTQTHNERSYTVKTNDGEYRRNRVHLNKSLEQLEKEYHSTPVAHHTQETTYISPSSKVSGQTKTQSGWISKPPDRWSLC